MTKGRKRLVWVTSLASPYRLPVWQLLAEHFDFQVWLLATHEWNRSWSVPDDQPYPIRLLDTAKVRRGEATFYAVKERLTPSLEAVDTVILPSWENPAAWQIRLAARRARIATVSFNESTVMSERSSHTARMAHRARRTMWRSVDAIVTVGRCSTELVERAGIDRSRIFEGRNSVDVDAVVRMVAECRERTPRPDPSSASTAHQFVFVGQLIERKRPEIAIAALAHLRTPAAHLTIVGQGHMLDHLRSFAHDYGVSAQVTFTGHRDFDEVMAILAASHTLVLPSSAEVWGLVVNEALAAGLNVVVSDRCGVAGDLPEMPGVWVTEPSIEGFESGMRASMATWTGPHCRDDDPQFRPEVLASAFCDAVESISTR